MYDNEFIVVIPARSGSKSIPKKNIVDLKGFPLISYSIVAGNMIEKAERTIISTDSEEIADIAIQYGAEAPFLRPPSISGDKDNDKTWVIHLLSELHKIEHFYPKYLIQLRPTTPLREPEILNKAVEFFLEHESKCSGMRSAHLIAESPYKYFIKKDKYWDNFGGLKGEEVSNRPKEMFENVYKPNGYIDIIKTETVLSSFNALYGNNILAFETEEVTEIDSYNEYEQIKCQIEYKENSLYLHLRNRF